MSSQSTLDVTNWPSWLDRSEYPFTSRWFDQPEGRMHYVDEGSGPILLFVHGNPSWSFEYRRLIRYFATAYRCVAIDHMGFGLSDHPTGASYLPQWHAVNLQRFIEALHLRDITLIVQDWGGPIALAAMIESPEHVRAIIASNSWFFDVREYTILRRFSRVIGSSFGRWLCSSFNLFPRVLMRASFGDPSKLPPEVHRQYLAPFPTAPSRIGTWVFPRSIVGESVWLDSLWRRRKAFANKPELLAWGMKDAAFAPLLPRWQEAFPRHHLVAFDDVGHSVAEEAGGRLIGAFVAFLSDLAR